MCNTGNILNIEADRVVIQRSECSAREFRYSGILAMGLRNSPSLLRLFIYPGYANAIKRKFGLAAMFSMPPDLPNESKF